MADFWKLLEDYKEVIVNSSDLLSFLLITPQLFALGSALLGIGVGFAIFVVFGTGAIVGLALTLASVYPVSDILWIAGLGIIWVSLLAFMYLIMDRIVQSVTAWALRYAFGVGFLLFILTRAFSLVLALHHVLTVST